MAEAQLSMHIYMSGFPAATKGGLPVDIFSSLARLSGSDYRGLKPRLKNWFFSLRESAPDGQDLNVTISCMTL